MATSGPLPRDVEDWHLVGHVDLDRIREANGRFPRYPCSLATSPVRLRVTTAPAPTPDEPRIPP